MSRPSDLRCLNQREYILTEDLDTFQTVSIDLLVAHPESCNFMAVDSLRKLRMHIERTGRYEPILVRPHPLKKSWFEIINGHNRVRVLRALHHLKVRCVVWRVDDEQTRLYMATLNRLSGIDIPERRAVLMERLLSVIDVQQLASMVPEDTTFD